MRKIGFGQLEIVIPATSLCWNVNVTPQTSHVSTVQKEKSARGAVFDPVSKTS